MGQSADHAIYGPICGPCDLQTPVDYDQSKKGGGLRLNLFRSPSSPLASGPVLDDEGGDDGKR